MSTRRKLKPWFQASSKFPGTLHQPIGTLQTMMYGKVVTMLAFLASADSFGTMRSDVCPPVTQEYDCSNEVGFSAILDFWFGDLINAGCWSCQDPSQPHCSQAPCSSNALCRGGQYAGMPWGGHCWLWSDPNLLCAATLEPIGFGAPAFGKLP